MERLRGVDNPAGLNLKTCNVVALVAGALLSLGACGQEPPPGQDAETQDASDLGRDATDLRRGPSTNWPTRTGTNSHTENIARTNNSPHTKTNTGTNANAPRATAATPNGRAANRVAPGRGGAGATPNDPGAQEPEPVDPDWVGLMVRGRVLITTDVLPEQVARPRWITRRRRRWVAGADLTRAALRGPLRNWVGAKLVAVDRYGRACRGRIRRLRAEARAHLSRRLERDDADRRPRRPADVFTHGGIALYGEIRWQRRGCGRRSLVARRAGAPLPRVLRHFRLRGHLASLTRASFRWSAPWRRVQQDYEQDVRRTRVLLFPRTWDRGKVRLAGYRAARGQRVFLAHASTAQDCGEPGGDLGLLMRLTDPRSELSMQVIKQWSALPELLLHLPGRNLWLGLDAGKSLDRPGAESLEVPDQDVAPDICQC